MVKGSNPVSVAGDPTVALVCGPEAAPAVMNGGGGGSGPPWRRRLLRWRVSLTSGLARKFCRKRFRIQSPHSGEGAATFVRKDGD